MKSASAAQSEGMLMQLLTMLSPTQSLPVLMLKHEHAQAWHTMQLLMPIKLQATPKAMDGDGEQLLEWSNVELGGVVEASTTWRHLRPQLPAERPLTVSSKLLPGTSISVGPEVEV